MPSQTKCCILVSRVVTSGFSNWKLGTVFFSGKTYPAIGIWII